MKKSKIISIILFTTILSLIFILLSYFGITRYISLHFRDCKKFVEQYNNLPKASKKRVIISFTYSENNIKPMINSILDQTVKVDQIGIVVPNYIDNKTKIPEYITTMANIFPSGKNYGKGNNLIPILLREKECDTIIIALDNNYIFGKDFIEYIIELSEKYPSTTLIDKHNRFILTTPSNYGCDVIDREKDSFNYEWFIQKTNKSETVEYQENYKMI